MARFVIAHQSAVSYARASLFACLSLLCPVLVSAQEVQDPTRPPVLARESADGEGVTTGPVLQSVLISPSRKIALIDGVAIRLGGKVGAYTLTKITETEVTLRQGRSLQVLKLHPDVEKKPVQINRKSNASMARP